MTILEDLSIKGYTIIENAIDLPTILDLKQTCIKIKQEEIKKYKTTSLLRSMEFEHVRDLPSHGGVFLQLLMNKSINSVIDIGLNSKAVVHSYNAIINDPNIESNSLHFDFHRDMPWFDNTRTSMNIFIPLDDFFKHNGATQVVPSTHLFKQKPSKDFLERNKGDLELKVGSICAMDSTLYHRAGRNLSKNIRPLITIKFTLAPFKQQIDFCESTKQHLLESDPLILQRLGWEARVCKNGEEYMQDPIETRKWKSGQYDMSNTTINEFT